MEKLNFLKSASSQPKKHIAEFCDDLCNKLDIATLQIEIEESENERSEETVIVLRANQILMVNEIKLFQNECIHNLDIKSIEFTNMEFKIEEIENQIENITDSGDSRQIEDIQIQIDDSLNELEQKIFNQKGLILFMNKKENWEKFGRISLIILNAYVNTE